ncbi:phosphate acetyltransferase [Acidiphilium sp. AL]|uniref:phosphate acyltransferase n=1 Tax=Acidiphilium sp. AL TaxID=2871704 RepID=UPI0021CB70F8|nr:phosphate acyltransferase [Acidiphilium sp. AL]MCU4160398.1 phosphate acetyltransferase [Acidiphilium sp. AL]
MTGTEALETRTHETEGAWPSAGAAGGYLCPPDLLLRARERGPTPMAVAAAGASDVLQSVCLAASFGLVEPILVGDPAAIGAVLSKEASPPAFRIVPAMTEADAARLAVGLVTTGEARLLMKGHLHTDALMRAVLDRAAGLRPPGSRLSHVFVMRWPGAVHHLLITDAALNVAPDPETTLHIVRHAIRVAKTVGIAHPRIAMLSASETVNAAMPSSVAAGAFAASFCEEAERSGCSITGPLALDIALSPESAALKDMAGDAVAGRADVLIVPNIETGNTLFKALVHLLHATAIGVVLGATVPVVLTSRADPMEAKLASIALAQLLSPQPAEMRATNN